MAEFRMPSLGADMEFGTLVEWNVHPGDPVKRGDVVAQVETEKGLVEIEIFEDGAVEEILVQEGQKVPVGTVLARIRSAAPEAPEARPVPPAPARQPLPTPAPEPLKAPVAAPTEVSRRRVSPLARKRAAELGIDLATVTGTGEAGAITVEDIDRAAGPRLAPARATPRPPQTAGQAAAMRHAIATAMARSKREIPHYYLATTIDMSRAMAWLAAENLERPVTERLLYSVLLLRAVALAVREVPEMNGYWTDGAFQPAEGVHIGVAISLRSGGLVAPAIHDVDRLRLDDVSRRLLDLVKRARAGVLRGSEISDATITVTNLGEQGVETVFGVIYPPQVALVGFGRVTEKPRAVQGMLAVHPTIAATLAADHRASDGHRGGRFLSAIDRLLQEPEKL
jgi:pyruvate dehydrogenase E2 component (dihydrolipoamide acetyltransferase)